MIISDRFGHIAANGYQILSVCYKQNILPAGLGDFAAGRDEWRVKAEILISVPGVGKVLAYTLVGVAPMNRESGSYNGKRRIRGGRHRVRTVMFMAMMSSIQCNPVFKRYYERLKAAGKIPKAALVDCMRKLIVILNTMVKNQELWNGKMA